MRKNRSLSHSLFSSLFPPAFTWPLVFSLSLSLRLSPSLFVSSSSSSSSFLAPQSVPGRTARREKVVSEEREREKGVCDLLPPPSEEENRKYSSAEAEPPPSSLPWTRQFCSTPTAARSFFPLRENNFCSKNPSLLPPPSAERERERERESLYTTACCSQFLFILTLSLAFWWLSQSSIHQVGGVIFFFNL